MTEAVPRHGGGGHRRNEGERLRQCLVSLDPGRAPLVYVDSGSTDGSVAMARDMGAHVVSLDMGIPFTAARARNAGFACLIERHPAVDWVQFVDGDCEVLPGWLDSAQAFLTEHPEVVAVTGRRNERFPERSVFNDLCDMDWQCRPGDTKAFGGDVLLRAAAFQSVGGYNPALIAGEEPELSIRLRRAGWRIWHLDVPMTLHDANILRFEQWWRRGLRTGFAYAEGAALYGGPPERHWVRQTWSACLWGLIVPLAALGGSLLWSPMALWLLLIYPVQVLRIFRSSRFALRRAMLQALFLVLGKFSEAAGVLKYLLARWRGVQSRIIEYK